jgi:4'-phosphopantetheinyl transferase EntD
MPVRPPDFVSALRAILPPDIEVAGHTEKNTELALAEERALTGSMVASRREEFLTGRTCARLASRRLGLPDRPLLRGDDRAPLWPDAVTGSISHCAGAYVAVVAHDSRFFGIGVDVERRSAVTPELQGLVATPDEAARFAGLNDWRTLAFSSKESVFKCLNPPTGIWLEFHDVELVAVDDGQFRATVSPEGVSDFQIQGAYAVTTDFVVSAVVIAAEDALARDLATS